MPDPPRQVLRLAAVGDVHGSKSPQVHAMFAQISSSADVLLLCGDLTDYGLPDEARTLAQELSSAVRIPMLAVLGNHEYEAGREGEIRVILGEAGVVVLDGESVEVHGVGFAGVKGFGGGFGRGALGPWGEPSIKQFVQTAVDEALKLERALSRLRTHQRVALLHYAPVRSTVEGEPPEIYPYLGSSRLEEPINRFRVTVVFHGHAHRGRPEGRTAAGVPVYNVAMPLLAHTYPDRPPYLVVELPIGPDAVDRPPALADPIVRSA